MPRIMIGLKNLRTWAAAKPPDEVVGTPRNRNECPIFQYIRQSGGSYPIVGDGEIMFSDGTASSGVVRPMTPTQQKIIHQVDRKFAYYVTAGEFLNVLYHVEQGIV
jgi:hypothetical protein